jgi:DNA replication protein DnaC
MSISPGHIRAPESSFDVPSPLGGTTAGALAPDERRNTMKATESKSTVLLHHHLKALRLPTVAAECEKVATQAAADNADHLAYLLRLTELELLEREKRAAERRVKAARFPTIKTLETFDFSSRPSVNKVLIAELMRCEYIDKKENILMVGNPGTGKSHLATALAAEACAKGYRVRFIRTTELVTALIEARDERSFLRLKGQFAKLDLLVLDELGYVPASKVGSELLFDVISTAYERTSLIVTTNLPFESWTEVLGSERLTGATLDRLTHRCRIIETKGESYRLQDAKARTRRPAKSVTETVDEPTPSS